MSDLHNHPPNVATTVCPSCVGSVTGIPHVWTVEQIHALPQFGAEMGWFYGLVECEHGVGVEIAEVIPGMGWTSIHPPDIAACWPQIQADLLRYRPR